MPYPSSPFEQTFNRCLITKVSDEQSGSTISNEWYAKVVKWLCTSPQITSYRVNTLKSNVEEVLHLIRKHCEQVLDLWDLQIEVHPILENVVIVHNRNTKKLMKHDKEIIVDSECGTAVLRGAHIYAPGILGMLSGSQVGDEASIYVDAAGKCKKGLQKLYEDQTKIFIGNGIIKMNRFQLFADNIKPSGIAVQVRETISGCPSLGNEFLPVGTALLQNLPSILCVLALEPKPEENIIDMCAAPGNKTTHIAELMKNKGNLVAVDKSLKKIAKLKLNCAQFGAKVSIYEADSTKIVLPDNISSRNTDGPMFAPGSFDKVLLDAPCSVLGKRPQFVNRLSDKEIRSYIPLQRKLLEAAVKLLKVNGTLIYSTCTITLAENEGIVAWALDKFKGLRLIKPKIAPAGPGWPGSTLTENQRECVQRFGPDQDVDSVGFFFAAFIKTDDSS